MGQIDLKHTKKAKNNASDYKNNKKDLCIPRAEKGVGNWISGSPPHTDIQPGGQGEAGRRAPPSHSS